ncbi:MAG: hypothetical protein A2X36_01350 [Elusimicrobia bacterium GWA2_69_24]|nr:MAG: hypothetical protein A2X36_01350 [Elusimicrobia bacterium GWA2_69_24]
MRPPLSRLRSIALAVSVSLPAAGLFAYAQEPDPVSQLEAAVSERFLIPLVHSPLDLQPLEERFSKLKETERLALAPRWAAARENAGRVDSLRGALTAASAEALTAKVRAAAAGLKLSPAQSDAAVGRYLKLRESFLKGGVAYDPANSGFKSQDGKALSAEQYMTHLPGAVSAQQRAAMQKLMADPFASRGDAGGLAGGTSSFGSGDKTAAIEQYRKTPAQTYVKIAKAPPPPPKKKEPAVTEPEKKKPVPTTPKTRAVDTAVDQLAGTLSGNIDGRMSERGRKELMTAWRQSLDQHTSAEGTIDYPKTVNTFQNILLNGREAGKISRDAEHWGEITAGTYNLGTWAGPPAAIGASLAWNTFSVTKCQLMRSYRYLRGEGPMPPAGNYWGKTIGDSLAMESAAAGWASTLPNSKKVNASGIVTTLKLDEFVDIVKSEGVLTTIKGFGERYFGK